MGPSYHTLKHEDLYPSFFANAQVSSRTRVSRLRVRLETCALAKNDGLGPIGSSRVRGWGPGCADPVDAGPAAAGEAEHRRAHAEAPPPPSAGGGGASVRGSSPSRLHPSCTRSGLSWELFVGVPAISGDGGNRTPVRRQCNRTSPGAVRS